MFNVSYDKVSGANEEVICKKRVSLKKIIVYDWSYKFGEIYYSPFQVMIGGSWNLNYYPAPQLISTTH